DEMNSHRAVGIRSITTGSLAPLEFVCNGGTRRIDIAAPFSVTGTESFRDGVLLGLGIAQMPVFHIENDLAAGRLVQILPDFPPLSVPVSVLYPTSRQLSPRVRLFIDWAIKQFTMREVISDPLGALTDN
ncbi:MAG TPA: LysR substrate-binding domain-containing protein, partial [Afipia sp.]